MGIMQALDNITAVLRIMSIIYDNGYKFNTKRVIMCGHSHGAYLSYLCNAFALIIDNSAWLYPKYLKNNRCVMNNIDKLTLNIEYNYLARKLEIDEEILNLSRVYSNFKDMCKIT